MHPRRAWLLPTVVALAVATQTWGQEVPAAALRGRVQVRGESVFLVLPGGRYRVRPYAMASRCLALDGEQVTVAGEITSDSLLSRRVRVDAVLDPTPGALRGRLDPQQRTLRVGERDVPLRGPEAVTAVLEQLEGPVHLEGYVRTTAEGPSAMVVQAVRVTIVAPCGALQPGEQVLLVGHGPSGFVAERPGDGADRVLPRAAFDPAPAGGLIGGLPD